MDRLITYAGAIPLESDVQAPQRLAMQALGVLMRAVLGDGPVLDGLGCAPGTGMQVVIASGMVAQLDVVDSRAFGVLPAAAQPLVKAGINLDPVMLALPVAPAAGQAVAHLVQAQMIEADGAPIVLPYYDAAYPTVPYSGPNNTGQPLNSLRTQRVALAVKPGVPAAAGSQIPPAADAGWAPAWTVTVAGGDLTVTQPGIALHPKAPFLAVRLPDAKPVTSLRYLFTPTRLIFGLGVRRIRVRAYGAGGPGGHGLGGGGGGGAGGSYHEALVPIMPGDVIDVMIGASGQAGTLSGSTTVGASLGGTTSISVNGAAVVICPGGGGGGQGPIGPAGVGITVSTGPGLPVFGQAGANGAAQGTLYLGGTGGGNYGFHGGSLQVVISADVTGNGGQIGSGGSGGCGNGLGGNGGPGLVVIES